MLLVFLLTWILESQNYEPAVLLWHWFGEHVILTILMLIFLV